MRWVFLSIGSAEYSLVPPNGTFFVYPGLDCRCLLSYSLKKVYKCYTALDSCLCQFVPLPLFISSFLPYLPSDRPAARLNPITVNLDDISEQDEVEGTVVRVSNYGVFVDIGTGVDAFLHRRKMRVRRQTFYLLCRTRLCLLLSPTAPLSLTLLISHAFPCPHLHSL